MTTIEIWVSGIPSKFACENQFFNPLLARRMKGLENPIFSAAYIPFPLQSPLSAQSVTVLAQNLNFFHE